jgi:hypothetical protein
MDPGRRMPPGPRVAKARDLREPGGEIKGPVRLQLGGPGQRAKDFGALPFAAAGQERVILDFA